MDIHTLRAPARVRNRSRMPNTRVHPYGPGALAGRRSTVATRLAPTNIPYTAVQS